MCRLIDELKKMCVWIINLWQLYIFNWFFPSTNSMEIVKLHTVPPGAGLIFFYPLMYLLLLKLEWNRERKGMWWIFDKESLWLAICQWGFLTVDFILPSFFPSLFQELFCDLCFVKKFDLHLCFMMADHLRHSIKQMIIFDNSEVIISPSPSIIFLLFFNYSDHPMFCITILSIKL